MENKNIPSPCISICKNDPTTGLCVGCGRSEEEKKIWKKKDTPNQWKKNNIVILMNKMSKEQLQRFEESYKDKITSNKKPQN
tara:strand:- start:370 stop:615 length:246 start_codon:yes stop_codon:yes gene_type:complete